jgi:hypothetical protein
MGRFERFMESWGLTTMAWMNSTHRIVRWAGIALGALACWLMLALMASWWLWQRLKRLLSVFGKR